MSTNDNLRDRLIMAVTTFDRKQELAAARSKRSYHNRYAIGLYFERINDVMEDIRAGATPRAAIIAGFDGRLLAACLKAVDMDKVTEAEQSNTWVYSPASERN